MSDMFSRLAEYLGYPFVRYSLIVGVLISLCTSLFGVPLVLKRFSFIGDGLSHVAFGALAIATVLRISNSMYIVLPVTAAAAIFLTASGGGKRRTRGDAAIAMFSVGALAAGYLLLNVFPASSNVAGDVCSTLFGSSLILTLSEAEVWLSVVLAAVTIFVFVFNYNRLFAITFDEDFSKASGINTRLYGLLTATVTAVIIVLAMNLVGSLLISALVVFPAMSAMRVCRSYKGVTVCSAIISVCCTLFGILFSIVFGTPVGCTVVLADVLVYIVTFVSGRLIGRQQG